MNEVDEIYAVVGRRIVAVRKTKNISQEQLSNLSGVDRSHIGFIEQGRRRPTLSTLFKLTRALKIELTELFRGIK